MVEQGKLFRVSPHRKVHPISSSMVEFRRKVEDLLSLFLAGIFFWFGVLKITGTSPMIALFRDSLPILAESPYVGLIGLGEALIAIGLVVDRFSRTASALLMVNLTFSLAIGLLAHSLVFAADSPGLTSQGASLARYIVLILAGMVVLSRRNVSHM